MGNKPLTQIFHPHQQELMLDYVEEWPWSFKQASEKGYPKTMNRAMYFCKFLDVSCHNHLQAYTTATEIAECVYLVGNTWVGEDYRGEGVHSEMLQWRNGMLKERFGATDIITLLNPQEGASLEQLQKVVSSLGYRRLKWSDLRKMGVSITLRLQIRRSRLQFWGKSL
jgi:hypothetical protein